MAAGAGGLLSAGLFLGRAERVSEDMGHAYCRSYTLSKFLLGELLSQNQAWLQAADNNFALARPEGDRAHCKSACYSGSRDWRLTSLAGNLGFKAESSKACQGSVQGWVRFLNPCSARVILQVRKGGSQHWVRTKKATQRIVLGDDREPNDRLEPI